MKVIKEICKPGQDHNEDYLIYNNDNYVLVLDGATGLGENRIIPAIHDKWHTDAQWFVQTFASLVKRHMDNFVPIRALVSECMTEISEIYRFLAPEATDCLNQPSASMALIKKTGDIIELFVLGDLTVLIQKTDGTVEPVKDDAVSKLDDQVLLQMVKERETRKLNVSEAGQLPIIRDHLKQNRMKMNRDDGYWVLGLDPAAAAHGLHKELQTADWNRIFVCSDGFLVYKDYYLHEERSYEQFMKEIISRSLHTMIKKIRKAESADPAFNRYPRFKISDDATAVLIVGRQELREQRKTNWLLTTNIMWHRVKGKSQSNFMTFGIKKAYLVTAVTALSAIIKIIYDILQKQVSEFDLITWGLLVLLFLVAFGTVISTISAYRASTHDYLIYADPAEKNKTLQGLKIKKDHKASKYHIETFYNGSENENYIISTQVNDYLLENQPIALRDLKHAFKIVDDVKKYVPAVLELTFKKRQITFNGRLLRQITDLYPGISKVDVQKTRYFDGQCTQEIVFKQFKSVHEINMAFDGKSLLMDGNNYCYPLSYSSCANFIGVSTMVMTRDHKIIIGRQGSLSKANRGRYAPSGSGSVGYADIKRTKVRKKSNSPISLQDVLITAMEREFCEECNYPLKTGYKLLRTQVIGYVRLLERGGKPDYFGISYINEDSENIIRGIRHSEYGLSRDISVLHYHTESGIPEVLRKFCQENLEHRQISIQVEIITQILERIAATQGMEKLMQKLKSPS